MDSDVSAGYCEHEHTADWELEVWAPSFEELLTQAARGMYALSGTRLEPGARITRSFTLTAPDDEIILVKFLAELLYLGEMEGLGFDIFDLDMQGDTLAARLTGARLMHRDKEIKAVTYHQMAIQHDASGLRVHIVFDV